MNCKKCNGEIDKKAVVCVHCGCKIKKPIYKKWWFWVIIVVIVAAIGSGSGGGNNTEVATNAPKVEETIAYEIVDLKTMADELNENAMKAENKYMNKYVEFDAKISNFDSDGAYIGVEHTTADEWNFETTMCYIKNDEQKAFLMEKGIGDVINIKGKVKSIGEIMGYSIDIIEVK